MAPHFEVVEEGFGSDDQGQIQRTETVVMTTEFEHNAHYAAALRPHRFVRKIDEPQETVVAAQPENSQGSGRVEA